MVWLTDYYYYYMECIRLDGYADLRGLNSSLSKFETILFKSLIQIIPKVGLGIISKRGYKAGFCVNAELNFEPRFFLEKKKKKKRKKGHQVA